MNLLPQPRSIRTLEGTHDPSAPTRVHHDASLAPQGYRMILDADGVQVWRADDAGGYYASLTLRQLRRLYGDAIPPVEITDWPDIPVRGVMLDVSRDKVPTLQTVQDLVTRLASWKINHLQLYVEHTFAYSKHREVWEHASPFTGEEIRDLDAHCRAHHVELAANQNCLGHMERWLRHDRYRHLAVSPDGWTDRRGRTRPPTTIDPAKPESLALVRELLGELLPNFTSPVVNVGLDEPWELPDERYDDYVSFIGALRALPELSEREMLMWGDIVARHPESAATLPDGVTICEWGYEAAHPFARRTRVLRDADRAFWVCPGTSSWNTLVGRHNNARENCRSAAESGIANGASGYLVTDWGDNGHLQYLSASEPMFAYAAAVSWCLESNAAVDLAAACDVHVFDEPTGSLSRALLDLGDAHRGVVPQVANSSILTLAITSPRVRMGEGFTAGLTHDDLTRVLELIASSRDRLDAIRPARPDGSLIVDEVRASADLLALLVRDARERLGAGGTLDAVPEPTRRSLAEDLQGIIERHRSLWLARNRPGGLDDSASRLERLRDAYLGSGN